MTKMTDRYSNSNLLDLAKQQHENKQRSKLPTEIFNLASAGKIYPKSNPLSSGQVEMRYMTAYDEDILTNASYIREGIVLDKLLQSLIVSDIDYNTIAQVDKDSLIIGARIVSYGAEYDVTVIDPKTNNQINRTVDLNKLKPVPFELESDENGEFDYEVSEDLKLKFGFPSSKDISSIEVDNAISAFLSFTIRQVNETRSKSEIQDFIKYNFLAKDSKKFRDHINDNLPRIDYLYEFEGENGSTFKAMFQIGSDLFWL